MHCSPYTTRHIPPTRGFSLVETIVGAALLAIVSLAVYQAYASVITLSRSSAEKITAVNLANERMEIIRNLPYENVGVVGGIPSGLLTQTATTTRDGNEYRITTTIRNSDDPFDGVFPQDTSPADYRLAEVAVECTSCPSMRPVSLTTNIAPKNLENTTTNGALYITVRNASAQPVAGASVIIVNNSVTPAVNFSDVTDTQGQLKIFDVKPSSLSYEITVTKNAHSLDKTYAPTAENPNPTVRHATVAGGQVTDLTFFIDTLGTLEFSSVTSSCVTIPNYDFALRGNKQIGTSAGEPVYKYDASLVTDGSGTLNQPSMEWDNYSVASEDGGYDLAGTLPATPLQLAPGASQPVSLVVAPKAGNGLMVIVKNTATKLPVAGATVVLTGPGYSATKITGRGTVEQSDWSGGAGQTSFVNTSRFYDSDGNIEINTSGQITLKEILGSHASSGWLTSSTFDLGSPASLYAISWNPQDQPPAAGINSVRFQIASNNDNSTWNYVGPDGTSGSYYSLTSSGVGNEHENKRYFRYKVYLQTSSSAVTPTLTDLKFQFTTACTPAGSVLFQGLSIGSNYTVSISAPNYEQGTEEILLSETWQQHEVSLTHQ